MINFIKRYEWLGTLSQFIIHWFACRHNHKIINEKIFKFVVFLLKHKYLYIKGVNKSETKYLKYKFLNNNKIYDYPTKRTRSNITILDDVYNQLIVNKKSNINIFKT